MKDYPSISAEIRGGTFYVFNKLDGSCLRAEWGRSKGLWKFGKRNGLIDHSNPHLLKAPDLIRAKYEDALGRIFREQRYQRAVVFLEFWGPRSFAGQHHPDDEHTATIIDVAADNRGFLLPRDFLRLFSDLDHAALLHHGSVGQIAEQVRAGTLPGMTFEGVVCKSAAYESPGRPAMFKIKNQAWYARLRQMCGENEALYEKLS